MKEKALPIGLALGFILIYGTIFMGDGWMTFFDIPSLVIVLGGTVAGLLVGFPMEEVKKAPQLLKMMFGHATPDLRGYVDEFTELSRVARREGLLALDRRMAEIEDEYLSFGLEMAIDGVEEDAIQKLMGQKLKGDLEVWQLGPKFFNASGTYCPAFGMIGTLIGLIQMMQNLSDPSQIGAGMATALVTTFYGALFANLVFLPMAAKMKTQMGEVAKAREMVQIGVLAIVQGDAPSMIEKRMKLFLGEAGDEGEGEWDAELAQAA